MTTMRQRARAATAATWTRSLIAGACLGMLAATGAMAAPASFPTTTTQVMLDGNPVGTGPTDWVSLLNTVVYDGGTYYMWYVSNPATFSLSSVQLATSSDGVVFTTVGPLAPPAAWWTARGATAEPIANYLRVSKVGTDWKLMVWHSNGTGYGDFRYNTSVWTIGPDISNPNITLDYPLLWPPGGRHVGPLGIISDQIYLVQDTDKGLGRYSLPMTTAGMIDVGDLYTGSEWCRGHNNPACQASGNGAFVHNYGRTLDQGGALGTYYAFRKHPSGARHEQQLWYVESTDGGDTWSTPTKLFTDGSQVTVDGVFTTGNFSSPEVALLGDGSYRSYFSTSNACGQVVMVTAATETVGPTMDLSKAFDPATVPVNGESALTVTLKAPALACAPAPDPLPQYTNIGYTDNLPAGLEVVAAGENNCGGTLTATEGATSFSLAGGSLAAGAECSATVTVRPTGEGVFENTIHKSPEGGNGGLTNDQSVPAAEDARATLRTPNAPVTAVTPVPTLSELSLGLLGLLAAGLGAGRLRRRPEE